MNFEGMVMFVPTPEEVEKLKRLLERHENKPDIESIVKANTTKGGWFREKTNWKEVALEIENLYIGWNLYTNGVGASVYPKRWVNELKKIMWMLSIRHECFITPTQAEVIKKSEILLKKRGVV